MWSEGCGVFFNHHPPNQSGVNAQNVDSGITRPGNQIITVRPFFSLAVILLATTGWTRFSRPLAKKGGETGHEVIDQEAVETLC
jgi:hypothetical protein